MADPQVDTQTEQAPAPSPTPSPTPSPAPQTPPDPQKGKIAHVNVSKLLDQEGLTFAGLDEQGNVKATDSFGRVARITPESTLKALKQNGDVDADTHAVKFKSDTFNTPETALNEAPHALLDTGDAIRLSYGDAKGQAAFLVDKYGKSNISMSDQGKAMAFKDEDGVWRKIAPDFHDDSGSWNWANTVYNVMHHESAIPEAAVDSLEMALGGPKGAVGGAIAQATNDTIDHVMGRIVGTTGETTEQYMGSAAVDAVMAGVIGAGIDLGAKHLVMPALSATVRGMGTLGQAAKDTTLKFLSNFGDGNATAVKNMLDNGDRVASIMDNVMGGASDAISEAAENGTALANEQAVAQETGKVISTAGKNFTGDVVRDEAGNILDNSAGKMQRNLTNWMNGRVDQVLEPLDNEALGEVQQRVNGNATTAMNRFRQALGESGVTVNENGVVSPQSIQESLGDRITPIEARRMAAKMTDIHSKIANLADYEIADKGDLKHLFKLSGDIQSLQADAPLLFPSAQGAAKNQALGDLQTVIGNAMPNEIRAGYDSAISSYAEHSKAINAMQGSMFKYGGKDVLSSGGERMADALRAAQLGDQTAMSHVKSLVEITPNGQQFYNHLQDTLSAEYMLNLTTSPTSSLGGAGVRVATHALAPVVKLGIKGAAALNGMAGSAADIAQKQANNFAVTEAANNGLRQMFKDTKTLFQSGKAFSDSTAANAMLYYVGTKVQQARDDDRQQRFKDQAQRDNLQKDINQ